MEEKQRKRNELIDRAMDIDQMIFFDDADEKVNKLNTALKYFDLDITCIFFR